MRVLESFSAACRMPYAIVTALVGLAWYQFGYVKEQAHTVAPIRGNRQSTSAMDSPGKVVGPNQTEAALGKERIAQLEESQRNTQSASTPTEVMGRK